MHHEPIPSTSNREHAARMLAEHLGLDSDELFRAAEAVWWQLNPQVVAYPRALAVAGVALAAISDDQEPSPDDPLPPDAPLVLATLFD